MNGFGRQREALRVPSAAMLADLNPIEMPVDQAQATASGTQDMSECERNLLQEPIVRSSPAKTAN
jgi:hypothetical protein